MADNLVKRVKKLRLQRGDCIVCNDPYTAERLSKMRFPFITFQVPIIFAPFGIDKIPVEQLQRIAQEVKETSRIILPNKI